MVENEEIVISGLAGRYPECNNLEELKEALLKGVDLITDDERRFPRGIMNIPPRCGKVPELDKFDSTFFGVHSKQAEIMDPRHRMLCETVYEAIIDAGFNPKELKGSNTGVYVGLAMITTPDEIRIRDDTDGYMNIGVSQAMAANRISYTFDFKGKSYTLDTACSSALYGFVNAVDDIKAGLIDAAIICGAHVLFHPQESSEFHKLNMLAPDGKCKVFSSLRDGYVRSEAVVSLLLQKKSASRRVYATIAGSRSNADGYTKEGITFPSMEMQVELMEKIYRDQISAEEVTYVEAHGTGTPAGDDQELKAIVNIFCANRKAPLSVGAIKTNLGHTEVSSGMCSVTKVLIAMETGVIPANLHTEALDTSLPGIKDGKIKIVTENLPWNGGTVAINCFGFGGSNAHIALRSNRKEKQKSCKRPKWRLVFASGRTEEAVNYFLDEIEKNRDDEEFLALVDEIHKMNCEGHDFRGYIVLGDTTKREVSRYSKPNPIWFIYTGMGAQWLEMGRDMMNNEVFRNTIQRCAEALKPYNLDLMNILTSTSPDTFESSTNCFVAIGAVEIALTDVLRSLEITPDGIAGHSLGEVGCSYADGDMTPEEAVLLAYARGYGSSAAKLLPGAMAAVGLSKEECLKLLPDEVYIACQNGKQSVTITGLEEPVHAFVDKLSSQGIFVRMVKSGLAYHSKYIKDAGPYLYDFVKKVIKKPTPRSSRWVSTSVSESQKNEPWANLNCAEYHKNNFCSPVLFDGIFKHIPEDAIVVEVAPHGLLQAILKRETHPSNTVLPLTNRNSPDNEEFFLSAIGKIYLAGGQPNLKGLYKGVSYPVSRGTKMLSPLVKWDHSTSWFVPLWKHRDHFGHIIRVNISNEKHAYLAGHNMDGRVLMPATGYLELAWRTLAHLHLKDPEQLPVVIENVKLKRATVLPPMTDVEFLVNIMKQSGYFEIFEGGSVVATGTIYTTKDVSQAYSNAKRPQVAREGHLPLKTDDIYMECHLRRYLYEGAFRGIAECDVNGILGRIKWQGNFISFLDTMLHLTIISETKRELVLPTEIKRVVIDPRELLQQVSGKEDIPIFYNKYVNVIRCEGVEIRGLDFSKAPKKKQAQDDPLLETYQFVPYETSDDADTNFNAWVSAAAQINLQNIRGYPKVMKIGIFPGDASSKLAAEVKSVLDKQFMVEADCVEYNSNDKTTFETIVLTEDLEVDVNALAEHLSEGGMIFYKGNLSKISIENLNIVYRATSGENGVYLLTPNSGFPSTYSVLYVKNNKFDWLEKIRKLIQTHSKEVVFLVSQNEEFSGVMGLVKCLSTEPNTLRFRCVLIDHRKAAVFSPDHEFYRNQLAKNMAFNVFRNGRWGTFVHVPLAPVENKQVEHAEISILSVGDLSTLSWVERSSSYVSPYPQSENVYVYYAALNFKDVMIATGKLVLPKYDQPTLPELNIGIEYSGITSSGKRVMGVVENWGLQVQTDSKMTWEVPNHWTLDEAATVPVIYTTCYYGMIIRGQMKPGESILIHAGTGGIGLGAISIALSMGCTVFTTVGSQEKKDYLKQMYPEIKDENIGDSRSTSFIHMVMEKTQGRGVDLVLNSLAGELFKESLACVAAMGRFIEIGKVEFMNNTLIESKMYARNCSFIGVSLDYIFEGDSDVKQEIHDVLAAGIKSGVVKPLPRTIFTDGEIEDAFRFLSSGKHKGKVLIELRKEATTTTMPPIRTISAVPKIHFHPNKSYILVGGLGGIGLELTDWLIRRGATKVVLNSRRDVSNGYQSYCFKRWSKWKGVTVKVNTNDTTTLEGAKQLVTFASRLGPVGGVFNLALVLMDGLIENQTSQMYEAVLKPKIVSGSNMDNVTRSECPELDHFVVFSSATSGRGNLGQSNYGMGNSAMEYLCEKRREENLPALAVQWGPVGEVGTLTKTKLIDKMADQLVAQNINSCIEALEKFMLQKSVVGSSMVLVSKTASKSRDVTKTPAEAVAHILGIKNLDAVNKTLTLVQLGLDSLMSAEIKQTLYRNYHLELSLDELRDLTFEKLFHILEIDENNNPMPQKNGIEEKIHETLSAILSKEPVVVMNLPENVSRSIFLIHPIEGHVELLRPIAKQLEATVYGLQCTKEFDFDNMQDYASYCIRQVKVKQPLGPYFLCGYSFGAAVALEMGLQLEKNGELVQIVLLDGSPAYVRVILEDMFKKREKSMDRSKTDVLINFVTSCTTLDKETVEKELTTIEGWENQLQRVGELISKEMGLDAKLVAISADRYYKRCLAAFNYRPESTFNGRVVLIRLDSDQVMHSKDYDLQQVCKRDVEIVKLKGDHNTILLGDNSRIISQKINTLL